MASADLELEEIVVSMETIKPSSPTPPHLLTHTLSWIDQVVLPIHIGMVLFYLQGDGDGFMEPVDISKKLRHLKQSLSEALSLYYVLAGRIDGASAVNCTDEGIDFIDARVSCSLSAVLPRKPTEEGKVDFLFPCNRRCSVAGGPLLIVKTTTFRCGGTAVGVCLHHTVADGQSLAFFLKTWAAIARGVPDVEVRLPNFDVAAAAFPMPSTLPPRLPVPPALERRIVRKRFVLDGSKICALREQSANQAGGTQQQGHRLTRVEAVTALIWRCVIRSSSSSGVLGTTAAEFAAFHAVGLRARMKPSLPEMSFGNLVIAGITPGLIFPFSEQRPSMVGVDQYDEVTESSTLRRLTEEQTSAAIRGVDDAYILRGPGKPLAALEEHVRRGTRVTYFSCMWGFPYYEADFGWGRPAWVTCSGPDEVTKGGGMVMLMGRREGSGDMEAWIFFDPLSSPVLMASADLELEEIVVSIETIKPSSPTQPHLLTHTLSWIDQAMLPVHIGMVLFYLQGDGDGFMEPVDISKKLRHLKQSLSEALSLYYVLAGRIGGASAVNCTDEGIDFIDARVSCPLSAVLPKKPTEKGKVDLLFPCNRRCTVAGGPLLIVKITTFHCGGTAVGLCLHHTVADGQSLAFFLKTWAAIARGVTDIEVSLPNFDVAASAFPLRIVRKRFVLDGSKICALREQSANQAGGTQQQGRRLTLVEAVTALIWRCAIRSSSSSSGVRGTTAAEFAAGHAVGLRARMKPSLYEMSFGNLVIASFTPGLIFPFSEQRPSMGGVDQYDEVTKSSTLRRLTEQQISAAIGGVDDAYVRDTLRDPGDTLRCPGGAPEAGDEGDIFQLHVGVPLLRGRFRLGAAGVGGILQS
ncbi:hypothetical protein Taro_053259 [Colocasia esculenta]|uniref:Uncharacterized protein n=1 Tax=Colocasia esculenta TaxID=4460 RepID=A0A843XM42_COLES|nr:hypothetical protein [Colocasia esculenta]